MYWFEVWKYLLNEYTLPPHNLPIRYIGELRKRVYTIWAEEARRQSRIEKGKYKKRRSYKYSRVLGSSIYPEMAEYYERVYDENFQPRDSTLKTDERKNREKNPHQYGALLPYTKNENYRYERYAEIISKDFNPQKLNVGYNEYLLNLYCQVPLSAFKTEEIHLFQRIYDFATKKRIKFKVVKRFKRRAVETFTMTYKKFCEWYAENKAEYSCKQRFFVPLFCEYERKRGKNYPAVKVDELIRYDAYPECFTPQDWQILGEKIKGKFFDIMEDIRETSKKK